MKRIFIFLSTLFCFLQPIKAQEYLDDIMLQSFGWDEYAQSRISAEGGLYEFYNNRAGLLKANGFDMIWLPPPSASTGGVGYFPTELFNFSQTTWGTQAQLTKMLANLNSRGINPIADVVANHRSGTTGWTDFTNPVWGCDAIVSNDEAATDPANTGCKPSGAADTGEGFGGSRDMDHTNTIVQNGYKEFLNRLKALGFKGWRWDVAKGFSAQYFGMYIGASQPYYSVGEYWDGNVNNLKNWINGTYSNGANISATFDFALYYTLSGITVTAGTQNASNNYAKLNVSGHMAGLAGEYGFAEKAVTFVDNHDTFVHDSSFQGTNIPMAYAYILTHPGIPCVFAPHYYGGTYSKDGITRNYGSGYANDINILMAIRKSTGINAFSNVTIDKAEAGLYAAYIRKTSSDNAPSIAVKIGPCAWTPTLGTGWVLSASGTNYSVWTKKAVNTPPTISVTPAVNMFISGTTQNVTITSTDTSGTAPTIRYTLDGTEPTASSPLYTAPIAISSTTTIKASAFDDLGLSSGTIEKTYTFNIPKTITIRFKPDGSGWEAPHLHYWGAQPSSALADANWSHPVAMTADPNNAGWFMHAFNNVTSINLLFRNGDPTGTIGVTKTGDITNVTQDAWYIWSSSSPHGVVVPPICATNPPAPVVAVAQPTCAVPTGTVRFNATTGYSYSIDNGTNWSTNNVFSGLTAGTYHLLQKTAGGCISTTSTPITVNALPETIQLATKNVTLDLEGASSVVLTPQQIVTSATASCGGNVSLTLSQSSFTSAGNYNVTITGKTASGATATASVTVTVKDSYATMPQLFNITSQDETCDFKNNGAIVITSTSNLAYSYSLNGGAWVSFAAPYTISNLNAGSYDLCIKLPSGTQFCYVLKVGAPANLTGKIAIAGKTASVEILSGSSPFTIQYGRETIIARNKGIVEIPLNSSADLITVTSSKLCEGMLKQVIPIENDDVNVYPNPVTDMLNFRGFSNKEINISLYSASGQKVLQKTLGANDEKVMSLKSLSAGMYVVVIQSEKNTVSKKIIKK